MSNQSTIEYQESVALRVREHILRMSTDGGCFTGASLSCTDLLVFLYTAYLNISPDRVADANRDILLLSKGHDVPALYGVLAEFSYIPVERLKNHLSIHDDLYWHPNRSIPGVEFHSGSLGHLLSVGMGMALGIRLEQRNARVIVVLGDGELNEGSVWEACLVAAAHGLDNLVAVVDRNLFQANMRTEELIPLEPLATKFEAFGWNVERCNGHDFRDMDDVFARVPRSNGAPTVVIADTQRGCGVPSIAERSDRWFCNFTSQEVEALIDELHGNNTANLTSPSLIVR